MELQMLIIDRGPPGRCDRAGRLLVTYTGTMFFKHLFILLHTSYTRK